MNLLNIIGQLAHKEKCIGCVMIIATSQRVMYVLIHVDLRFPPKQRPPFWPATGFIAFALWRPGRCAWETASVASVTFPPTSHDLGGGLPIKRLQVAGCLCCPNCMLTMLTQKFWFGYDDSEVWKCRSPGMSCWKKHCALRFKLSNAVSNMLGWEPFTINAR